MIGFFFLLIDHLLEYINGLLFHLRLPRYERMDYETFCDFLKDRTDSHMYQLFMCIPKLPLTEGLNIIENDQDICSMYDMCKVSREVKLFMSHILQNLAEYYYDNFDLEGSGGG